MQTPKMHTLQPLQPLQPLLATKPMTHALLIIDVQQGLCEGDSEGDGAAFESARVIARINAVSAKARAAGVLVIFIQHESTSGYLEFETDAWQLAQGLHIEPTDERIRKTTQTHFCAPISKMCFSSTPSQTSSSAACTPSFVSTPPRAARWRWATRWCWLLTPTRQRATRTCQPAR